MGQVITKIHSCWDYLIHQGGLILSCVLTIVLSAIGYPKQIIIFIGMLIIIDVVTRFIAETILHYSHFTLYNFLLAWKDKVLNSKKLKHGLFIKIFFYIIILYIANQTEKIEEMAFGDLISNFLYSILVILDLISIFENALDCGFSKASVVLKFLKRKEKQLLDTEEINKDKDK